MSGNAREWCSDTGGSDFPAGKQVNPCAQGGYRAYVRGGMHDTDAKACRVSAQGSIGAGGIGLAPAPGSASHCRWIGRVRPRKIVEPGLTRPFGSAPQGVALGYRIEALRASL